MSINDLARVLAVDGVTVGRWEHPDRKADISPCSARWLGLIQRVLSLPEPARAKAIAKVRAAADVSGLHAIQALLDLAL